MDIVGVDFSGSKADNVTWMASGSLTGRELTLHGCRAVKRADLLSTLEALPGGSVAALDFPFSVPLEFARFWQPQARSMTQLWQAALDMDFDQFIGLRDEFVDRYGEPKRLIDTLHPESYSCLHKVNPNMVPMTFRGMQMLARLWPAGCDVPPLPPQGAGKALLLEVMPGAVLRALELPFKGYKNGTRTLELRRQILEGLPGRIPLELPNLEDLQDDCMASHDCLDAVVAAVAAALWSTDPAMFRLPAPQDGRENCSSLMPNPMIEGWLYAPVHIGDRYPGFHPG
ncbi:MAG: DUF429 domain-containing protein [Chloroflexi bacterium]|nr:DUF429 domain-containing protein [Chloroflexota bacterium]